VRGVFRPNEKKQTPSSIADFGAKAKWFYGCFIRRFFASRPYHKASPPRLTLSLVTRGRIKSGNKPIKAQAGHRYVLFVPRKFTKFIHRPHIMSGKPAEGFIYNF
jgi:hypothetical protein